MSQNRTATRATTDREPTKAEITAKLDELGAEYNPRSAKADLEKLLNTTLALQAVETHRDKAVVRVPDGEQVEVGGKVVVIDTGEIVADTEPMTRNVVERLTAVMRDMPAIPKSQNAPQQMGGFAFRGIDQFYDAAQPLLAKHGVVITPKVLDIKRDSYATTSNRVMTRTLLTVRYRFHGADGDHIDAVVVGEGSDTGDKSATKALATASKYALMQTLCAAVEGHPDADQEHGDRDAPEAQATSTAEPDDPYGGFGSEQAVREAHTAYNKHIKTLMYLPNGECTACGTANAEAHESWCARNRFADEYTAFRERLNSNRWPMGADDLTQLQAWVDAWWGDEQRCAGCAASPGDEHAAGCPGRSTARPAATADEVADAAQAAGLPVSKGMPEEVDAPALTAEDEEPF